MTNGHQKFVNILLVQNILIINQWMNIRLFIS